MSDATGREHASSGREQTPELVCAYGHEDCGWASQHQATGRETTVHVLPINDLIDHDSDSGDCPCGPTTEVVMRDDGSNGWLVTHHSPDGREATE